VVQIGDVASRAASRHVRYRYAFGCEVLN